MGLITSIVNTLTGGLVGQVGEVIAKTNTSDKERLQLQKEIEGQVQTFSLELVGQLSGLEAQLTERQKLDMSSDSWLSKNVRPVVLVYLTLVTTALAYLTIFALDGDKSTMLAPWISMLKDLCMTVYGFYFGSRGIEKIGQMVTSAWQGRPEASQK